jgi:hypothetical protein
MNLKTPTIKLIAVLNQMALTGTPLEFTLAKGFQNLNSLAMALVISWTNPSIATNGGNQLYSDKKTHPKNSLLPKRLPNARVAT